MPRRYSIQWAVNDPRHPTRRWTRWHATETAERTLCGRQITTGPWNNPVEPRTRDGTGEVDCKLCRHRLAAARPGNTLLPWREIPLSQGKVAIVDAADYPELSRYRWHYEAGGRTGYAARAPEGERLRSISMHRQITGAPDGMQVDHINRNGLDNRRANLRICTRQENLWNRASYIGRSRFKGVHWHIRKRRWYARIQVHGHRYFLGVFKDEEAAARAYDTAARQHLGPFAFLNVPERAA